MTTRNEQRRRIRQLQTRLAAAGLYRGPIDGVFGPGTRDALARWPARRPAVAKASERPPGRFGAKSFNTSKGLDMLNVLSGYRTYIVAGIMLLTGLAGVLGLDVPSFGGQAPGNLVLEALAFFFLRQGLKTK